MSSSTPAFSHFLERTTKDRVGTDIAIQAALASIHPDRHITRILASQCDLLGFAEAGLATSKVDLSHGFDAARRYSAPKLGQSNREDKISDDVRFAAWDFVYDDTSFLVYEVSFHDYFFGRLWRWLYILTPSEISSQADAEGHHPVTDKLIRAAGRWTKATHDEIWVFDDQQWKKDKELWKSVQGASWDDVVLDERIKTSLLHDVETFFDNRELYRAMKVPWKRGVIFHGVPGNGKTVSLKALINSLGARDPPVPAMYVKSLDGCSGPKVSMQRIFSKARIVAPCLLIFEDLDSLVEDKTRSYFLNEVDGLDSNEGILMIGSTNHLGALDPAITKRPSRFDRKYHFKVPDETARVAYCRFWQKKLDGSAMVEFPDEICGVIAKLTDGFSFAYIKELFITSLLAVARRHQQDGEGYQDEDSDSSSNSGVVVDKSSVPEDDKTGGDKKEKTEEEKKKEEEQKKKEDEKKNKPKRVMPEVEIPDSLKGSVFMECVLAEAKLLWEQMDNSEEEAIKLKKAAATCSPNTISYARYAGDDD
ncbi:P-loop containing nucleoside triphosphate hydrolase protein [Echria macrotheca]|uniref:P-loop containing nucleoside triphosphate hydrolase protein n=1 Tax=Echria macrotheca TaxID=438768 RepID=A0AAJ0B8L3_9PEZI|nr:P-loop containing nucleoside triphosphate hydrolase protein [Echria macrotheca]